MRMTMFVVPDFEHCSRYRVWVKDQPLAAKRKGDRCIYYVGSLERYN